MSRVRGRLEGLRETSNGEVRQALLDKRPSRTVLEPPQVEEMLIGLHPPAASFLSQLPERLARWLGQDIHGGLLVVRDQRVHIHKLRDALARVLGDAGDDHSRIAVADEHGIGEIAAVPAAQPRREYVCPAPRFRSARWHHAPAP